MCFDPVSLGTLAYTALATAAAETPLLLAGTVVSTASAVAGGVAANQQAKYGAAVAEENARAARMEGTAKAEAIAERYDRLRGQQRAQAAASGVNPTAGSAALIINQETGRNEYLDTMSALWNANSQATAYQNEAAGLRASGRNSRNASYIDAGATFLTGLGGMRRRRLEIA